MSDVIAIVKDYTGLQQAMRARGEELKMSRALLDAIAGTHDGHAGKMLANPPSTNIGITTFGLLLQALGLKLLVVEDIEQMAVLKTRIVERNEKQVRHRSVHTPPMDDLIPMRISRRLSRRYGAIGGKKRWSRLSPRQRTKLALRMNEARHGRRKNKAQRSGTLPDF